MSSPFFHARSPRANKHKLKARQPIREVVITEAEAELRRARFARARGHVQLRHSEQAQSGVPHTDDSSDSDSSSEASVLRGRIIGDVLDETDILIVQLMSNIAFAPSPNLAALPQEVKLRVVRFLGPEKAKARDLINLSLTCRNLEHALEPLLTMMRNQSIFNKVNRSLDLIRLSSRVLGKFVIFLLQGPEGRRIERLQAPLSVTLPSQAEPTNNDQRLQKMLDAHMEKVDLTELKEFQQNQLSQGLVDASDGTIAERMPERNLGAFYLIARDSLFPRCEVLVVCGCQHETVLWLRYAFHKHGFKNLKQLTLGHAARGKCIHGHENRGDCRLGCAVPQDCRLGNLQFLLTAPALNMVVINANGPKFWTATDIARFPPPGSSSLMQFEINMDERAAIPLELLATFFSVVKRLSWFRFEGPIPTSSGGMTLGQSMASQISHLGSIEIDLTTRETDHIEAPAIDFYECGRCHSLRLSVQSLNGFSEGKHDWIDLMPSKVRTIFLSDVDICEPKVLANQICQAVLKTKDVLTSLQGLVIYINGADSEYSSELDNESFKRADGGGALRDYCAQYDISISFYYKAEPTFQIGHSVYW